MKQWMFVFSIMLAVGCGEDANGVDAVYDTDIEQTDAGLSDVVEDVSEVEHSIILLDFDLESVPSECLMSNEGRRLFTEKVIVSFSQFNSGQIPFTIDYHDFVKESFQPGYATAFKTHPYFIMLIRSSANNANSSLDARVLLYELGAAPVKIGEQSLKTTVKEDGSVNAERLHFIDPLDDPFVAKPIDLLEGDYALEVETESDFDVFSQLNGSAYFVDLDCLD